MYDKLIGVNSLDENYLICVFMNINQNVENRGKTTVEFIAFARFWMDYKIFLEFPETFFHVCQYGQCGQH